MDRVAMLWLWQRRTPRNPHLGTRSPPKVLSSRILKRIPSLPHTLFFILHCPHLFRAHHLHLPPQPLPPSPHSTTSALASPVESSSFLLLIPIRAILMDNQTQFLPLPDLWLPLPFLSLKQKQPWPPSFLSTTSPKVNTYMLCSL